MRSLPYIRRGVRLVQLILIVSLLLITLSACAYADVYVFVIRIPAPSTSSTPAASPTVTLTPSPTVTASDWLDPTPGDPTPTPETSVIPTSTPIPPRPVEYITTDPLRIREQPGVSYAQQGVLDKGTRVIVYMVGDWLISNEGYTWVKVHALDGEAIGWVAFNWLEEFTG